MKFQSLHECFFVAIILFIGCGASKHVVRQANPLQDAIALIQSGKFSEAERSFHALLNLAQQNQNLLLQAQSLKWLGNIQLTYGKNDDALALYREAEKKIIDLIVYADSNHTKPSEDILNEQVNILNNQALVFKQTGKYVEAIQMHEDVLKKDIARGNKLSAAMSLNNLGNVYDRRAVEFQNRNKPEEAQKDFAKARECYLNSLDQEKFPDVYVNLGNLFAHVNADSSRMDSMQRVHRSEQLDSSVVFYGKAQRMYEKKGDKVNEAKCFGNMGVIALELNQLKESENAFRNAIDIIEVLRGDLSSIDVRSSFVADKYYLYENLVELLVRDHKIEEAFEFVERAKARSFLDMLGNKQVGANKHRPASVEKLIEREKSLQARMSKLVHDPDSTEILVDLIEEHQSVLEELRKKDPEYASVKSIEPTKVKDLQKLLDDSTAIVEYFLGEVNSFVFVLRRDSIFANKLDRDQMKGLSERVERIRRKIYSSFPNEKIGKLKEARLIKHLSIDESKKQWYATKTDISWQFDLITLYSLLFSNIESKLQGISNLFIIPHGVLHLLPFHALVNPRDRGAMDFKHIVRPKFLIERFAISYLPSASVLKFAREKESIRDSVALIVGDPLYADPVYRKMPLDGALVEADSVARYFPKSIVLKREAAEEKIVKEDMTSSDVIHLATHGELNKNAPMQSRILLAAQNPTNENNGNLTVAEVFNMSMNASLVTLSACQSAELSGSEGKIQQGDELVGLTRSFLYAGTPSVIASLWFVDDAATLKFMISFYSEWTKGKHTKAHAMRNATLQMLNHPDDPDWIFPYYWAAFILVGDML